MEYRIIIDDNDREECLDTPWTANVYREHESGESEVLGSGFGSTPAKAVQAAVEDVSTYTDAPALTFDGREA